MVRWMMVAMLMGSSLGCGGGASEEPPPPAQAGSAGGESSNGGGGVSRDDFLAALRPLTPQYFCADGMYFRQCFAVTAEDCQTLSLVAFDACSRELYENIPPTLSSEAEGEAVGEMLGTCAGSAYETGLAESGLRYDTAVCNDPSNWVPG